jgi:hypothetical protein
LSKGDRKFSYATQIRVKVTELHLVSLHWILLRMFGPNRLGASFQLCRLGFAVYFPQQGSVVLQTGSKVWMRWAKRFFQYC